MENNVSSSESNLDSAQTNFKLLKQNYDIEIFLLLKNSHFYNTNQQKKSFL